MITMIIPAAVAAVAVATGAASHRLVSLLLLTGKIVFVVDVDASTLIKNVSYKNQKIHAIADVICSKESIEVRHHRHLRRLLVREGDSDSNTDNDDTVNKSNTEPAVERDTDECHGRNNVETFSFCFFLF
jgi:hypothetical protein